MNYDPHDAPVHFSLTARVPDDAHKVFSPAALDFAASLHREFNDRRLALLDRRVVVQARIDNGWKPDFLNETAPIRVADWRVAPPPADLRDRRVEITGPVDRKMIINGLNSGANVYMADFEDSTAPTWANVVAGQVNLADAVRGTITFQDSERGKSYALNEKTAVLIVRPRGWHLDEAHMLVDGQAVSAGLFDFAIYLFNNAKALLARGSGPYFYLPKMENHLEARLWADVFAFAEGKLGLTRGLIRATVLIETILAAFEMDEILFELKDYIVGLNCGRWDYIFSYIKKFRNRGEFILPDRAQVTMESPALRAYSRLLIQTCHRRGAHAMGGMAAQIPIRGDDAANAAAVAKVRADKEREVLAGHDGTWVAHPALVQTARDVFDAHMPTPNQVFKANASENYQQADLLQAPSGTITEAGLRQNIRVGVLYVEAWLRGIGCVPLYNLMEDAATAEISRAQIWQWVRHGACTYEGITIDEKLVRSLLADELTALRAQLGPASRIEQAAEIFSRIALASQFEEFLTLPAYQQLLKIERPHL